MPAPSHDSFTDISQMNVKIAPKNEAELVYLVAFAPQKRILGRAFLEFHSFRHLFFPILCHILQCCLYILRERTPCLSPCDVLLE